VPHKESKRRKKDGELSPNRKDLKGSLRNGDQKRQTISIDALHFENTGASVVKQGRNVNPQ